MAYIQQRGPGLWFIQVSLGTGAQRIRRSTLFKGSYQKAAQRAKALEDEIKGLVAQRAAAAAPRGPTLGDWLAQYEREHVARLAPTSQSNVRQLRERYVQPTPLAAVPLTALTSEAVRDWLATLDAAGLAPSTRHLYRGLLRAALRAAVARGLLAADPTPLAPRVAREQRGGVGIRSRPVVTLPQARALLRALDALEGEARHEWRALWYTALLTGLRLGELRGLRVRDVDLTRAELSIAQQITEVRGTPILGPPKWYHQRPVPLVRRLVGVLRDHLADLPPEQTLVFSPGDEPFSLKRAREALYRLEQAAGLPERLTPHGLRRSYATLMLAAGANLAYVSWWMGHADPALTRNTYSGYVPAASQREAARLEAALDDAEDDDEPEDAEPPPR